MPIKTKIRTDLNRLKKRTQWSWERMCREMHRVMGEEGPSHTTLYRYGSGKVSKPNVITERYVKEAMVKLEKERVDRKKLNTAFINLVEIEK